MRAIEAWDGLERLNPPAFPATTAMSVSAGKFCAALWGSPGVSWGTETLLRGAAAPPRRRGVLQKIKTVSVPLGRRLVALDGATLRRVWLCNLCDGSCLQFGGSRQVFFLQRLKVGSGEPFRSVFAPHSSATIGESSCDQRDFQGAFLRSR